MSFTPVDSSKNSDQPTIYDSLPSSHLPELPDPIALTDPIREEAISWRTKAWVEIKNNFAAFASTVANGFSSIGNGIVAIGCSIFQFCFSTTQSSEAIEKIPENSFEADVKKANDFLTLKLAVKEEWIQRLNQDGLTRLFDAMTDDQKDSFLENDLSDKTKAILVALKIFDLDDFNDEEDEEDVKFVDIILEDPTKKLIGLDEAVFVPKISHDDKDMPTWWK